MDVIFGPISGTDSHLDALQMSARAFVLFFVILVLVRVAGVRAFGRKSSFDSAIAILLGAVMSRAVIGASPVVPIVAASTVFVVLHRLIGMLTARSKWLEILIKGRSVPLYEHGHAHDGVMVRGGISNGDLIEATRTHALHADLSRVETIYLETSGTLTVIKRASSGAER